MTSTGRHEFIADAPCPAVAGMGFGCSCIPELLVVCLQSCDRLGEAVISVDINADLRTVVDQRGTGPNQPEQYLLDYYVSTEMG